MPISVRTGSRRRPTKAMKSTPTAATVSPTGEKSNMLKARPVSASRTLAMMMLGGVPIRVIRPPSRVPKESGIKRWLAGRPRSKALFNATGRISASAPTLFMKAEQSAPRPLMVKTCRVGCAVNGCRLRAAHSTMPEWRKARDSTRTAATVITAGWPKPMKASSAGTRSLSTAANRASTATTS